eukprot:PhM_4_TR1995/c0_g1_i1/m.8970
MTVEHDHVVGVAQRDLDELVEGFDGRRRLRADRQTVVHYVRHQLREDLDRGRHVARAADGLPHRLAVVGVVQREVALVARRLLEDVIAQTGLDGLEALPADAALAHVVEGRVRRAQRVRESVDVDEGLLAHVDPNAARLALEAQLVKQRADADDAGLPHGRHIEAVSDAEKRTCAEHHRVYLVGLLPARRPREELVAVTAQDRLRVEHAAVTVRRPRRQHALHRHGADVLHVYLYHRREVVGVPCVAHAEPRELRRRARLLGVARPVKRHDLLALLHPLLAQADAPQQGADLLVVVDGVAREARGVHGCHAGTEEARETHL